MIVYESQIDALGKRVEQLKSLKPGWLDGHGSVPTPEEIDWTKNLLIRLITKYNIPKSYVYPTEKGGIQVEWSHDGRETSLEISFPRCEGYAHSVEMSTLIDKELTLDLNKESAEQELAEFILNNVSFQR